MSQYCSAMFLFITINQLLSLLNVNESLCVKVKSKMVERKCHQNQLTERKMTKGKTTNFFSSSSIKHNNLPTFPYITV